ncbi:GNAT family N-acetyltransferase [Massilia glaciei]|nr:GNAT family N-acetyltransferase [Massilia glaciei]
MNQVAGLDNPIWTALTSVQAPLAETFGALKRFTPAVAPFCAVRHAGDSVAGADGVRAGETVYFVGAFPALPDNWTVVQEAAILQMVYGGEAYAPVGGGAMRVLDEGDFPDVLALTGLVYPEYFRPRTASLGNYIGIHDGGKLVAMAGQRFKPQGYREISAVCTHPGYAGRGYGRQLIGRQVRDIAAEGAIPFLHVGEANPKARALYEKLGFVMRIRIPFLKLVT